MAKAICSKSGVEFEVSHFPYYFRKGELSHPVFILETKTLLGLVSKWANREFTETDTKLYFLALLNSTNLIEWRTYARPEMHICEANMEALIRMVAWIDTIKHPNLSMPKFAITKETANLANAKHWIEAWVTAKAEFENGYREYTINQKIIRREHALEKLIKDTHRTPESYAAHLAEWAAMVAQFPTFAVKIDGKVMTCSDYWKDIIRKCGNTNYQTWKLDKNDLQELTEHIIDNVDHGSIFAAALLKLLRAATVRHSSFLGLEFTTGPNNTGFTILDDNASIEQANIQALIAGAPETEPREFEYPTRIAYLRAKIRWEMASRYATLAPSAENDANSNPENPNLNDMEL
jgi:hypothetical protein